jgi:4'-phosphopantetheinyl transferase
MKGKAREEVELPAGRVPAPRDLALPADQVHVWRASLKLSQSSIASLRRTLTQDELNRAARYRAELDRDRFTASRGLLRAILGRYLGMPPERLRFSYGPYGKPALVPDSGSDKIQFNVSHCCDSAFLAFARNRRVGVDLECIRSLPEASQLADRYFSAKERLAFHALPEGERLSAFFRCWTRKEAFVKARGEGLALPLDGFDVSLAPDEPAKLLAVREDAGEAARWSLRELPAPPGHLAALAVEGSDWHLCCYRWREVSTPKAAMACKAGARPAMVENLGF